MSVMSDINHPNIMHLYEFMETTHNYYLVIQYCNNGDLEEFMKKVGNLSAAATDKPEIGVGAGITRSPR